VTLRVLKTYFCEGLKHVLVDNKEQKHSQKN